MLPASTTLEGIKDTKLEWTLKEGNMVNKDEGVKEVINL